MGKYSSTRVDCGNLNMICRLNKGYYLTSIQLVLFYLLVTVIRFANGIKRLNVLSTTATGAATAINKPGGKLYR